MDSLIFFLLGLPLAFAAERLIKRFDRAYELEDAAEDEPEDPAALQAKRLPWQSRPWSDYLRRGVVLFLPPLSAFAGSRFEPLEAVAVVLLLAAFLVCTATDLLRYRVPNAVTYPSTALVLLAALLVPGADTVSAVVAALAGGGIFLVMAIVTRGGLGLGDVKLAVLIGAALGMQAAYEALVIGVVAGGLIILALFLLGLVGRRQAVPYAPFLALAAVAVTLLEGPIFAPL